MDVKTYVSRLLEDLAHVTSGEERDAFDPAWLRGYVAGVATAAQYALEGERESERSTKPLLRRVSEQGL